MMKTVCVFCSSSNEVCDLIKDDGARLGRLLAEQGRALLYGGTSCGLMKIVADAHKSSNGYLIGVIPGYMKDCGKLYDGLDEIIEVEDLRPRKQVMLDRSDFIVALPGGIGTYDEFFDLLSLKMINRHNKPMYLLNTDEFYEPFLQLIKHGIKNRTIKPDCIELFKVFKTPEDLVREIKDYLS